MAEMNFSGNVEMTLDEKSRVGIPAKFMQVLRVVAPGDDERVGVMMDTDRSLKIMPVALYDERMEFAKALSPSIAGEKDLRRLMLGFAEILPLDKQNRIALSPLTIETCGLQREVIIVGNSEFMSLHNKSSWQKQTDLDFVSAAEALSKHAKAERRAKAGAAAAKV